VCKEITANQVKVWHKKGKISSCKLSVKYAILNKIEDVNWVPTTHSSDIATGLPQQLTLNHFSNAYTNNLVFLAIKLPGNSNKILKTDLPRR